jgi:hypothetical protein
MLYYNIPIVNEQRENNMFIFVLNAGGYYAVGTAVVSAPHLEKALELANEASDPKWGLTYHGKMTPDPVGANTDRTPRVLNIHEWGMPELPSKGSGKKVTF